MATTILIAAIGVNLHVKHGKQGKPSIQFDINSALASGTCASNFCFIPKDPCALSDWVIQNGSWEYKDFPWYSTDGPGFNILSGSFCTSTNNACPSYLNGWVFHLEDPNCDCYNYRCTSTIVGTLYWKVGTWRSLTFSTGVHEGDVHFIPWTSTDPGCPPGVTWCKDVDVYCQNCD